MQLPYARLLGEGPPVLFVHGLLGSSDYWGDRFDALARSRRLCQVDLPGFGRSMDHAGPYDLTAQARHLALVHERILGGGPVDVVGHSYGALLGLALAAGSAQVRSVVAFNLPAYRSPEEARRLVARAGPMERLIAEGSPLAEALCAAMCALRPLFGAAAPRLSPTMPVEVARAGVLHTWPSFKGAFDSLVEQARPASWIEESSARVRVVLGAGDEVCPVDVVQATLRGTRALVRVRAGGHHLPLEDPAGCLREIEEALA